MRPARMNHDQTRWGHERWYRRQLPAFSCSMVEAGVVPPGEVIGARVRTPRVRALTRERVDALFDRIWDQRLCLVVAPAGSGKTTALAQFAERSAHPVAWYRAEENDESLSDFLAHLARALTDALPGLAGSFETVRGTV